MERIVFQVEVEPDVEPISGLIRAGEREVKFEGWVGLAGALEQAIESGAPPGEAKVWGGPPHEVPR